MHTQEVRITAQLTIEVPIGYTKEELDQMFGSSYVKITDQDKNKWHSILEVVSIEEEAQIYETE